MSSHTGSRVDEAKFFVAPRGAECTCSTGCGAIRDEIGPRCQVLNELLAYMLAAQKVRSDREPRWLECVVVKEP